MTNFKIKKDALNIHAVKACQILSEAGYQAYLVGGCVRDILLGLIPKDFDITTDALPDTVMKLFPHHYKTGLKHGTVTIGIEKDRFEITTFRIEGKYQDGRRPEEVFFVMNVEQDLSRRDFTINAIAYDPLTNKICDPYGGILDLSKKIIKAVGEPEARFSEDGLRILRAARFAARFDYEIESKTLESMGSCLEILGKISKERIKDELSKILMGDNASYGLSILHENGALNIMCPLIHLSPRFIDYKNLGELETRLAFLYNSYPIDSIKQELISLKFSGKEVRKVIFLLELLNKFRQFSQKDTVLTYKSFVAILKNHSIDGFQETFDQFINLTDAIFGLSARDYFHKYDMEIVFSKEEMQIDGKDLLEMGVPAGPEIKRLLDLCYLEILRNPNKNNELDLLNHAASIWII